jgi:hypothetical protein
MGRRGKPGRWPQWAAAGIVVAAAWVLYAVWRSPNRDDYATYGAFAVAVIVIVPAVLAWAQRKSSGSALNIVELDPSVEGLTQEQRKPSGSAADIAELDPSLGDLRQEQQSEDPAGQAGTPTRSPPQSWISALLLSAVRDAATLTGAEKVSALSEIIRAAVLAAPERVKWLVDDAEAVPV